MTATLTDRLGLVKDSNDEHYAVETVNDNSDKIDAAVGFEESTSSTRPSAPYNGKGIWESDTGSVLYSNGGSPASGSWRYLWTPHGPIVVGATGSGLAPLRARTTDLLAGNRLIDARKNGEAQPGWTADFDGKLQWGPGGSTSPDTNLYRYTGNTLRTDGHLNVGGHVSVGGDLAVSGAVSGAVARGYIAQTRSTSNSSNYNAETMLMSVTFTAVAGRRYRVVLNSGWTVPSASTNTLKFRWASGASVTTSGTETWSERLRAHTGGAFDRIKTEDTLSGLTAGQVTVGVTLANDDGIGGGSLLAASNNVRTLTIYDVGV
jgi:hypothetical protein